ncbi:tagaturonate reductase [Acerihabitans sp. KWT182]|uniref:Tagaturonate reductase n=1 Tax=Acerihabitans sp. KWT182 TaxID=3157919 RepID=A0AAU7QE18_9GAMM
MNRLNRRDFPGARYPDKIIQFGEGNFLRAFIDWQIDILNEHTDLQAGVVVVRPIDSEQPPSLNTQDGLYTTLVRGLDDQEYAVSASRLIRSVNREISVYRDYPSFLALARDPAIRFVFSNTTEAGIGYHAEDRLTDTPPVSYPAKLTQLLYERFRHFSGAAERGWVIIPCELIDYNGDALRTLVLRYAGEWGLPAGFIQWIEQANVFCSTLVDRIVTGYPRDEAPALEQELGYRDAFLDTAEPFYLFVIQGPQWLAEALRLDRYPLQVRIVDDIAPYKARKVAILNGAHTALVPVAFLSGLDTVGEAMADDMLRRFIERMIAEEIIPTLALPRAELDAFAQAVLRRFRNPYLRHQLLSIALNSMTKFRTRILPQLLNARQLTGALPARLTFALAALIAFHRGRRGEEPYPLQDDAYWLDCFKGLWADADAGRITVPELVRTVLSATDHWQQDLTRVPGLAERVADDVQAIADHGMRAAVERYC